MDFEGIPGVMGRSNLRAKAEVGGYNIVEWRTDSIFFAERRPGRRTLPVWNALSLQASKFPPSLISRGPLMKLTSPISR